MHDGCFVLGWLIKETNQAPIGARDAPIEKTEETIVLLEKQCVGGAKCS